MKPIRVAIVGCGRISDLHEIGYHARQDAIIAAVCDTNKSRSTPSPVMGCGEGVYRLPTGAR